MPWLVGLELLVEDDVLVFDELAPQALSADTTTARASQQYRRVEYLAASLGTGEA